MIAIVSGLTVILGIGLLIFVHELGHFLVAKKVGIRVEAFSLGFGPKIFGFERDGTVYKFCAIPLGGYVKMAGEAPGDDRSGASDEFWSKTIAQRAWVVSAGVIMNVIFAFIAFPIAFSLGVEFTAPVIGAVSSGGPAWTADIRPTDVVRSIDGTKVISFEDIQSEIAFISKGETATFELEREGRLISRRVTPRYDPQRGINVIDVRNSFTTPTFVDDWSDLSKHGIGADDEIVAINGIATARMDIAAILALEENHDPAQPVELTLRRPGSSNSETHFVTLPPDPGPADPERDDWVLGIVLASTKVQTMVSSGENGREEPTIPERLGLREGDVVEAVNGRSVYTEREYRRALIATKNVAPFTLTVRRGSDGPIELVDTSFVEDDVYELLRQLRFTYVDTRLRVVPDFAAARDGVMDGDVIVAIDDKRVDDKNDSPLPTLREVVTEKEGKPITLRVIRGESELDITVTPQKRLINRWASHLEPSRPVTTKHREGLVDSFVAGFHQTINQGKNVLMSLKSFLTGNVASKNVGGIIFIAQASYSFAEQGLARVLFFFAILSLNLAILNILPIPVLDGGHLVFLLIEKIKGGPLSERAMGYATWVGMILLLALMVFATFNDIRRLVG